MTTPAERIKQLVFRKNAPADIRKAATSGDLAAFQKAVLKQHRTARKRLEKSLAPRLEAILWSVRLGGSSAGDRELALLLAGSGKQSKAAGKLAMQQVQDGQFGCLGWLAALDRLIRNGKQLEPENFASLYCGLSSSIDCESSDKARGDGADPMVARLIGEGEIPFLRGLVFADLKDGNTRKDGAAVLREGLDAATDTDGFLHAEWSPVADGWLAPLVRSVMWGTAFGEKCLAGKFSERLADVARHCATLLIPTGLVNAPPVDLRMQESNAADVIRHALKAVGIRSTSTFPAFVEGFRSKKRRSKKKKHQATTIYTSNQSDWAESALMRTGLTVDADVCSVTWDEPGPKLHLAVLGTPLLSGPWASEIVVDGTRIGPVEQWGCSCWFSDDEAAFVELEADPNDSVHMVRHVMLSLKDRLAVICESVTTDKPDSIVSLTSRMSLVADPLAVTNSVTRDISLHSDCISTRVIPSWLEDDRIQHADGRCEKQDGRLVTVADGVGGVTAPLVLDWHPERQAQDADWSRLTVTESRVVSTSQTAAGFRIRIGKHQLLIYRSLRSSDIPRAVLGQHTTNETIYGRVRKSGDVSPLVLVDGETSDD
jgi:hypothetical protein